jgi:phosphoribosylglycinamide formyltransferase-1
MKDTYRLVVLASGNGLFLQTLLDACEREQIEARVAALATDKKCRAIKRAENAGLPIVFHPWGPYKRGKKLRETYERDLAVRMNIFGPDLIILDEWERPLTPALVDFFEGDILHLHTDLPEHTGSDDTRAAEFALDAFQANELDHIKIYANRVLGPNLADGPKVAGTSINIHPDETISTLKARIRAAKNNVLVSAVNQALGD